MTVETPRVIDWGRKLTEDVFRGPAATLPINTLCHKAYLRGLLSDGKFSFISEVAEIMQLVQPNGTPPKPLKELDLVQFAKETGRKLSRIIEVTSLMEETSFIPTDKND